MTRRTNPKRLRLAVMVAAVVTSCILGSFAVSIEPASAIQSPVSCANATLVNGSFETPVIAANNWALVAEASVTGWVTSATDDRIEVWRAPFQGVPVPNGSQFIELNGTQRSNLHQDFATTPGETIRWQVQHRGRTGVDTMEVRMGGTSTPLALQATLSTGQSWVTYSGFYTVPASQTTTRLSFNSISSANGNPTYGNFIDAVSVTSGACVLTTKSVVNLAGGASTRLGDTLQYSISTTSLGASAATLASVVDALPVGVSLVPGSITVTQGALTTSVTDPAGDDPGEYDSGSREVRVRVGSGASAVAGGSLAVGESVTVSFRVVVDSIAALPAVNNTATVLFTDSLAGASRVSTSNTTLTSITPDAPSLSIVTTGTVSPPERQNAAAPGDVITWSYAVTNTGDVALTDVTIIDPEGGSITCLPTALAVGETAACTGSTLRTVTAADLVVGSVSNGATARATPPFGADPIDALESLATITTAALAPAIGVSVSHTNVSAAGPGSPIVVGHQLRASFVVVNTGNTELTTVAIVDPVFGAVTCTDTSLAPGESTTCVADALHTVTAMDSASGTISRTIRATGSAVSGAVGSVVFDEQLVTLDIAAVLASDSDRSGLAWTGATVSAALTLSLILIAVGMAALGAARFSAVRRGRRPRVVV